MPLSKAYSKFTITETNEQRNTPEYSSSNEHTVFLSLIHI